jgi:hypothetical protein
MENLKQVLENQLSETAQSYIEKVGQWAKEQVARNIERREAYYTPKGDGKKWHERTSKESSDYYKEQKWVHRSPSYYFDEIQFVSRAKKEAQQRVESLILKLVYRVTEKGLNESKIEVLTARVGVNIETTITDGEKTIRAFTIIAEGPIVRPHYRYLIK